MSNWRGFELDSLNVEVNFSLERLVGLRYSQNCPELFRRSLGSAPREATTEQAPRDSPLRAIERASTSGDRAYVSWQQTNPKKT